MEIGYATYTIILCKVNELVQYVIIVDKMNPIHAFLAAVGSIVFALWVAVGTFVPALAPKIEVSDSVPTEQATSTNTTVSTSAEKVQNSTHGLVEPTQTVTRGPAAEPALSPSQPITLTKIQNLPQAQVNDAARAALVNILCTTASGGYFAPISGSGVIIDSRGIILTNAHVGQFLLLRDYGLKNNIQCVVRTGSPAAPTYTAELLYLPPAWIADNASQIIASQAHGTGQYDYAFLHITGTTNPAATLPASFPHVAMNSGYPDIGDQMLLAAYPAGFLSGEIIEKNLYASSALSYVTQLFSFDNNLKKVDLFSIGGSVVSQAGSSGGAVMRLSDGTLAGIIATATLADSTEQRDLRAITLSHIDATLRDFGQGGLIELLSGDIAAKAADFNTYSAPSERAALYKVLDGQ